MQHIAANGSLRDGLNEAKAAELVWALSSPELFQLLTDYRGWTKEQYAAWLADTLRRLLLH